MPIYMSYEASMWFSSAVNMVVYAFNLSNEDKAEALYELEAMRKNLNH